MVQLNVYPLCKSNNSQESGVFWYPDKNDTNRWNYGEFTKSNNIYTLTGTNITYNFNSLHPYKYTHARNLKEVDHSYVCKVTHLQS